MYDSINDNNYNDEISSKTKGIPYIENGNYEQESELLTNKMLWSDNAKIIENS